MADVEGRPMAFFATNARWPRAQEWAYKPKGDSPRWRREREGQKGYKELIQSTLQRMEEEKARKEQFVAAGAAMLLACATGDREKLKTLLDAEVYTEQRTRNGQTPLMLAAARGDKDMVDMLLIRANADANASDSEGVTAAHFAAYQGRVEVLVSLLESNTATAAARTKGGETPLVAAAKAGRKRVCETIMKAPLVHPALGTVLAMDTAAANGHTSVVEVLLQRGVRPSENAATAAAGRGHTDALLLLLHAFPAAIERRDKEGMTPLLAAARAGAVQCIEALLKLKASPETIDSLRKKRTALHYAARSKNGGDAVSALLQYSGGRGIEQVDSRGRTPLFTAVEVGNLEGCKELLSKGALINVRDRGGVTVLHVAAKVGIAAMVDLLLEAGADVTIADEAGQLPRVAAQRAGKMEAAEKLSNHARLLFMSQGI